MAIKCPKCQFENTSDSKFCKECGTQLLPGGEPSITKTIETPVEEYPRGSTFADRYKIIEKLGTGGMGAVYRVEDTNIGQDIALKLIKPDIASYKKTIERFRNELKTTRMISHRNVCRMFDLAETEGAYYITMEYVPGEDLKSFIRRSGKLDIPKAISVAKEVCEGLSEAHRLGVVHRDLKSSNIMIDKEGNARIMDFGIARSLRAKGVTGEGIIIGTPEYMSPEQAEAKEVDHRSDIYSLGVILYEMVTGQLPFEGDTPLSIAMKHKGEMPKDPKELNTQISDDLNRLTLRCLEKDKEKRYQSASEVLSELDRIEQGIPTTERIFPKKKLKAGVSLKTFKPLLVSGIFLLIAILIIYGYFIFREIGQRVAPKKEIAALKIVEGTQWKNSIAVLPFADLSPQKDQEYFCDGMTDDIISKLSRLEKLKVSSRTSVMRYKKADKKIKEIGQELGVATILEGSIQKENNRIRVSAQLIHVEDNFHLWAQSYDRKLESVFDLQDDISKAIADALRIRLTETEAAEWGRVPTESVGAYEYYLKGRSLFYTYEKSKNERAIAMFKKALELDSLLSLAHAGISLCYSQYSNSGWDKDEKWLILSEDAAKRAIELDANSAEAHFALGFVYEQRNAYEKVERVMQRVLELNPSHAHAHNSLGDIFQRGKGKLEEAIHEYNLSLMFDPFLKPSFTNIACVKLKQGKYEGARNILLHLLEVHENDESALAVLGKIYRFQGEYKRSLQAIKKALMIDPSRIGAHLDLGLTYVLMKKYKDARAEADFIAESANIPKEKNFAYLYLIGWISLEEGKLQAALESFEQALRIRRAISREKEPKRGVSLDDIHNALAETYLRQKNYKAAIQEYSRINDLPVGSWQADEFMWAKRYYKMATAHEKINDLSNAKREYETFLKLWKDADPDIAEVENAKERLAGLKSH